MVIYYKVCHVDCPPLLWQHNIIITVFVKSAGEWWPSMDISYFAFWSISHCRPFSTEICSGQFPPTTSLLLTLFRPIAHHSRLKSISAKKETNIPLLSIHTQGFVKSLSGSETSCQPKICNPVPKSKGNVHGQTWIVSGPGRQSVPAGINK